MRKFVNLKLLYKRKIHRDFKIPCWVSSVFRRPNNIKKKCQKKSQFINKRLGIKNLFRIKIGFRKEHEILVSLSKD